MRPGSSLLGLYYQNGRVTRRVTIGGLHVACQRSYHLDISKIQHYLNADISAMSVSLFTPKKTVISITYISLVPLFISVSFLLFGGLCPTAPALFLVISISDFGVIEECS